MRSRRGSIKLRIILPLLVPLISLTALWAFAASITLGDGLDLLNVRKISDHFSYPAGALNSAMQKERRASLTYLGGTTSAARATMESQRIRTDQQEKQFRKLTSDDSARDAADATTLKRTAEVQRRLSSLKRLRSEIDGHTTNRHRAFDTYTEIVTSLIDLQGTLTTLSEPNVARESRSLISLTQARELLSEEDALLSGSIAAGHMTSGEHTRFTQLVGAQRHRYTTIAAELPSAGRSYYDHITGLEIYGRLRTLENRVMAHNRPHRPLQIAAVRWKTTADSTLTRFRGLELASNTKADQDSQPVADTIIWRVVVAGVVGLIALILSIVLSLWVARSVAAELRKLRDTALELANERLPGVISRLRRNADVDTAAEAPPLSFGTREVDQVGAAFNAARRTAIESAVGEAKLRRSVSEIFVNLARRSQTLVHRQLSLLDAMEQRVSDPEELEDLFRLDHLSTRMRRHAEGLIILSGSAPGRGWHNPVPIIDVVRGAASEVEDYARVKVQSMPQASLSGPAVADVIHLLAELIENSTLFSPPHTPVRVAGQLVANGFVVEIEDRGLSMNPEDLQAANDRLAEPPEFDLSNSSQLGLFVVGRLANRHDIKIALRTSPYGGTTAIVLLPPAIIIDATDSDPERLLEQATEQADPFAADLVPVGVGSGEWAADRGPFTESSLLEPSTSRPAGRPGHDRNGPWISEDENSQPLPVRPTPRSSIRPVEPVPDPEPPSRAAGGPVPSPPPQAATPPAAPSRPTAPRAVPERAPGTGDGGRPKLPQRVPQTSLAPELKEVSATTEETDAGDTGAQERSPEQVRSVLGSIQQGWLRGRSEVQNMDDDQDVPGRSTSEEDDR